MLSDFDKNFHRATARLQRRYRKLEFRILKGTPFMFRPTDDLLPTPDKPWRICSAQKSHRDALRL
jgi:hypothetical protein